MTLGTRSLTPESEANDLRFPILLALSLLSLLSLPAPASEIDDLNSSAIKAFKAREFEKSEKLYLQAIKIATETKDSKSLEILGNNIALLYREQGRTEEAKKYEPKPKTTLIFKSASAPPSSAASDFEPFMPIKLCDTGIDIAHVMNVIRADLSKQYPEVSPPTQADHTDAYIDSKHFCHLYVHLKLVASNVEVKNVTYELKVWQGEVIEANFHDSSIIQETEAYQKQKQQKEQEEAAYWAKEESKWRQQQEAQARYEQEMSDRENADRNNVPNPYARRKYENFGDGKSFYNH